MKDTVEEKSGEEWIYLFNGTSFDQWRGYLNDDMYPEWTISEGAMAFSPGKQGGKNIITKEKFSNFILSLEWKVSEGGNSGIFWAVHEDPQFPEPYQTGPEVQVLDNDNHHDSFLRESRRKAGAIYDLVAYPGKYLNPAGSWNLCELEVNYKSKLAKVTMNNKETVEFPIDGPDWDELVRTSKFKDWEGFGKYHTGHIGLQDHGNNVWYRNIKIKKLD
jgi:hypothetical protein